MTIKGLIYFPTWMNVLSSIEDGQKRKELTIKADVTLAHCFKIIEELENRSLIKKEKKIGRNVMITLTKKGKELKKHLLKIKEILEHSLNNTKAKGESK